MSRNITRLFRQFITLLLCAVAIHTHAQEKVTVAAAANMTFVLEKIKTAFEKETGIHVEIISGSSGKLTAQIKEGAPFDVFVSADMTYPMELFRAGLATAEPKSYATGLLVLWTTKHRVQPDVALRILSSSEIKAIAVANPKTAPYGQAAEEVLKHYGIYDQVKSKLVFGENISQTAQFVLSKAADFGFVAKSLVLSDELKGEANWVDIDPKAYSPIVQGAVLLKPASGKPKLAAVRFYDYLYAPKTKRILQQYGYQTN